MTTYFRPNSVAEALENLAHHPDLVVISGGTDLMIRSALPFAPAGLLDVFGLDEMVGVKIQRGHIKIGSATTHAALAHDPILNQHIPSLSAASREIGSLQIQNRGTIGGNIANSSPAGDLLPVLLAIDASIILRSCQGERRVPYREFCTSYRKTVMNSDELIVQIEVPVPAESACHYWRKVGTRLAHATSKVMIAGMGQLDDNRLTVARVGIGAVADRPIRLEAVEELLLSGPLESPMIEKAKNLTLSSIEPIDDFRSSATYRRTVSANLVGSFIKQLLAKLEGDSTSFDS